MASRLGAIRLLDAPFADIGRVGEENETLLVDLAKRSVVEDAADVVLLAGAPLAGLAGRVRPWGFRWPSRLSWSIAIETGNADQRSMTLLLPLTQVVR